MAIVVCSLTAAGVGLNLQVASNVVLAELSWTDAEQTQAIDRIHRIGQGEPVTAWRIIAAQTLDAKIAELIDSKAGLAARALDGSDEEVVLLRRRTARGARRPSSPTPSKPAPDGPVGLRPAPFLRGSAGRLLEGVHGLGDSTDSPLDRLDRRSRVSTGSTDGQAATRVA